MRHALTLRTLARAGAIAVALGVAATGLPAQAAPPHVYLHMHRHFGHPFWPGPAFGFRAPWYGGYWGYYPRPYPRAVCMTDWQVRNSLSARGYHNISLYASGRLGVGAQAVRGGWLYSLRVDRCTGAIISVRRMRHY